MYDSLPLSYVRVWLKPFKSTEPLGQLSQLKKKTGNFFCLTNQSLNFVLRCMRTLKRTAL